MNINEVKKYIILEAISGSHAYGMNTPESDIDYKGICLIPDRKLFYGKQVFEQQDNGWTNDKGEPIDKVIFHLPKFLSLASQANPNIIELLYTDPQFIISINDIGQKLIDNRELFLSKKARHTFSGYAFSQLMRIKHHRKWIISPPIKPTHDEYRHRHIIDVGPLGSEEFDNKTRIVGLTKVWGNGSEADGYDWYKLEVEKYDRNGYESAKKEWDNYTSWKNNRNEARAELEAKYQLDTKHAAHLVRLLRLGYEILTEGKCVVLRPDAKELLAIRNGEWSYDKIVAYAEEMDAKLKDAEEKSTLPWGADFNKIEELQMELIEMAMECSRTQRRINNGLFTHR